MSWRRSSSGHVGGFLLLEAILAVAIFGLGVLSLGRCVSNCLNAERLQLESAQAQRALENRMALIESGAVPIAGNSGDRLGAPEGLTLKQSSAPLSLKNENNAELTGLMAVTLEVNWQSGGETQSRQLTFYVRSRTP